MKNLLTVITFHCAHCYILYFANFATTFPLTAYVAFLYPTILFLILPVIAWSVLQFLQHPELTDGAPRPSFQRNKLYAMWSSYLSASVVPNLSLGTSPFIVAIHPHGLPLWPHWANFLLGSLPFKDFRILADSSMLRFPLLRETCLFVGCVDYGRTTAAYNLKKGRSLVVFPGGHKEVMLTRYQRERVNLLKVFGFVKLAIQSGTPLLPCYAFGAVDMFSTSDFLYELRMTVVRMGICVPFFWGPMGLMGPHKVRLTVVVGDPVDVGERRESPSRTEVAEVHARYCDALQVLFDTRKGEYGYGDRTLEFY